MANSDQVADMQLDVCTSACSVRYVCSCVCVCELSSASVGVCMHAVHYHFPY